MYLNTFIFKVKTGLNLYNIITDYNKKIVLLIDKNGYVKL